MFWILKAIGLIIVQVDDLPLNQRLSVLLIYCGKAIVANLMMSCNSWNQSQEHIFIGLRCPTILLTDFFFKFIICKISFIFLVKSTSPTDCQI